MSCCAIVSGTIVSGTCVLRGLWGVCGVRMASPKVSKVGSADKSLLGLGYRVTGALDGKPLCMASPWWLQRMANPCWIWGVCGVRMASPKVSKVGSADKS
jgi:hypothetical protein